ncbi:BnaC04g47970D [Brassica napus]|uniref:BnaC04g47970D protein n=1 Tax=Brassica napus TaxID=3708 RepID=A0A078FK43_BRANA|nr:BnaC04g47970D [Brassica napus]
MYDNRILRYFKGHKDRVVSLCMSPINDSFMSGSLDGSVRLWDLRVNACQLEEFERAVRLSRGNCRDDTNGFVCRFEPDMLAFSGCYYGGGDKEMRELAAIRRRWKTLHVMPTCVCVRGGMMIGLLKQGSYAKEKFCSLCI